MKQKTKKAAKKRFTFSATGSVKRRRTRQAHFNSRATGNATRKKHSYQPVHETDQGRLQRLTPYN